MRKYSSLSGFAAMAAIALAGSGLSVVVAGVGQSAQAAAESFKQLGASKALPQQGKRVGSWDLARLFSGADRSRSRRTYSRPGWPVAVDRRRAAKARRVKANRKAHRG